MNIMQRRLCISGGLAFVTGMIARPTMAQESPKYSGNDNDLRQRLVALNTKDTETVYTEKMKQLVTWDAIKPHNTRFAELVSQKRISKELLDEMHDMYIFYKLPLNASQRIRVRTRLMNMLKETRNDDEHTYIMDIIAYFGLLDDELPPSS